MSNYNTYEFARLRHIGPSLDEMKDMLDVVGAASLDALIDDTIPAGLRQAQPLSDRRALSEHDLLDELRGMANKNRKMINLIGQGYHGTFTPSVILRNVLENPAWYTAYTPYQPEISQGRLEALLNFQTMIIDLTGLDVANASLLDEATACAEAMALAKRTAKSKSNTFFVDKNCHPQNINVVMTRAEPLGIEIIVGDVADMDASAVFGALFQYPGTDGRITDFTDPIAALHANKAVGILAADILSLALLKSPAEMGADIAVGTTQRFGIPMGFGGPHAAYMAVRDAHKRSMPGRIVGVSVDTKGRKAYRLSLQTREQHIRREKATSNICTAQALLAVAASFYAIFHGPKGLRNIAENAHKKASFLASQLTTAGIDVAKGDYFDTLTVTAPEVLERAYAAGINFRDYGDGRVGVSLNETVSDQNLIDILAVFGVTSDGNWRDAEMNIPTERLRTSAYMLHPVFNQNRAETEIMRYMRKLADRDLALDRTMIPLGSCTMKLNSASEMMSITWPEFANIHPYAPADQVQGYIELIDRLSELLCEITGYDGLSMQPNSGAQGEFAGLLTIRDYHRSRGDHDRKVCLIPVSAHGTNPASAQMAGMDVVIVKSMETGDIDLDDFRAKAEAAGENLAACMITYPSTHGVFEATVKDVCDITHEFGGQVYIDGANMNAMVGLVRPGDLGGDVSHLNLHKTFCIPHGGGGPGMGPIGVKEHLIPFLPHDPNSETGAVSAARFGSPMILPISYAYCRLMGGNGLTQATRVAILNANYIASRLSSGYGILFSGSTNRVAHECIIDTRPFAEFGITVDDIAKRLVDYGFHAPTMSWPVAGTLMIEPTESESKAEIDRFCDVMLSIREEIRAVENGTADATDNVLKNAPHILDDIIGEWKHPYTRAEAVATWFNTMDKYFAPVNRIDNAHGDRNLICSCPPLEAYVTE